MERKFKYLMCPSQIEYWKKNRTWCDLKISLLLTTETTIKRVILAWARMHFLLWRVTTIFTSEGERVTHWALRIKIIERVVSLGNIINAKTGTELTLPGFFG